MWNTSRLVIGTKLRSLLAIRSVSIENSKTKLQGSSLCSLQEHDHSSRWTEGHPSTRLEPMCKSTRADVDFDLAQDPDGSFCNCARTIGDPFRLPAGADELLPSRNLPCREFKHFARHSATSHRGKTKIRSSAKDCCNRLIVNGGLVGFKCCCHLSRCNEARTS